MQGTALTEKHLRFSQKHLQHVTPPLDRQGRTISIIYAIYLYIYLHIYAKYVIYICTLTVMFWQTTLSLQCSLTVQLYRLWGKVGLWSLMSRRCMVTQALVVFPLAVSLATTWAQGKQPQGKHWSKRSQGSCFPAPGSTPHLHFHLWLFFIVHQ